MTDRETLEGILAQKAEDFAAYAERIESYLDTPATDRPPIEEFAKTLEGELTKDRNTVNYCRRNGEESTDDEGEQRPVAAE